MKIDQEILALLFWAILLALGNVALIVFGIIPIINDIIHGKNVGVILVVLSLAFSGYFVSKYFKKDVKGK